ncbi:MAG: tetratricopeptide repeat protein [Bacteroidota bacterium]
MIFRTFSTFFFVLILSTLLAQVPKELLNALENAGTTYQRAKAHTDIARKVFNKAPHECIKHAEEARKILSKTPEDTLYILSTNSLGLANFTLGDYSKAKQYVNSAKALSEEIGNDKFAMMCTANLGAFAISLGNYPEGIEHSQKVASWMLSQGDSINYAIFINNVGTANNRMGNYDEAMEHYFDALKILERAKDTMRLLTTYAGLGEAYDNTENDLIALQYEMKTYKLATAIRDTYEISQAAIGLANIYSDWNTYDSALYYNQISLKAAKTVGYRAGVGAAKGNIGLIYNKVNEEEKAIRHLQESYDLYKEIKDTFGLMNIGKAFSKVLIKYGSFDEAEDLLIEAMSWAEARKANVHIRQYHLHFSKLYDTTGQYKKAFHHFKKFEALKDEQLNVEKSRIELELHEKYKSKKLSKELSEKEEALKSSKSKILKLFFITIGLIIFIVLLSNLFRKEFKSQKKVIQEQDSEIAAKNEALKTPDYLTWKSIALPYRKKNEVVLVGNIIYIESDNKNTKVFVKNKDAHIPCSYTLKDLHKELPNTIFIRIHKAFVVNMVEVKSYNKNKVIVSRKPEKNETKELPVGKTYKDEACNRLELFTSPNSQ